MTKSIRNILLLIFLLCVVSFTLFYAAKPLSVLECCQAKSYDSCDAFYAYFREGRDECNDDYVPFKGSIFWETGGFICLLTILPLLLFLISELYRIKFKSTPQTIRLNEREVGGEVESLKKN